MIKQLIIDGKKSYDDFNVYIGTRNISQPKKKSVKESVPFSNVVYDFSKLDGEIYWDERTLKYEFDIAELSTEEMEIAKSKLLNWLLNVHDTDIYDPYIGDYHFHGSYDSDSWTEDFEKGTITVSFSVYPYKISNKDNSVVEELGLDGTGVNNATLENSGDGLIRSLKFDGASYQELEPTPDTPQEVEVIESVDVNVRNKNHLKNVVDYSWEKLNSNCSIIEDYIKVNISNIDSYAGITSKYSDNDIIYNLEEKECVYSFYAKADEERTILAMFSDESLVCNLTSEWQRYSIKVSSLTTDWGPIFYQGSSSSTAPFYIKNLMVEKGTNLTNYEPYTETTKTIDLQDNFIGAIGDVKDKFRLAMKDGKPHLYLDKYIGKVVLDGSENWAKRSDITNIEGTIFFRNQDFDYTLLGSVTQGLSSHFKYSTLNALNTIRFIKINTYAIQIGISDSLVSDVTTFKEWLASNNVEVYYVLAEPYEVDLGVVEIPTYYDVTHLFVETGFDTNIEVAYDSYSNLTIVNDSSHRITPTITSEGNFTIKLNDVSYSVGEGVYNSGLYLETGENNLIVNGSGKVTFNYVEEVF